MNADWERMLESMRSFFRTVPGETEGGGCRELDGILATVTPAIPDRSLPNSVIYESEEKLEAALDELARIYDEAGVRAWTVWTPFYHERARELLAGAGHVLDANPEAMLVDLGEVEAPREDDPEPDPEPSGHDLGLVNDRAYGLTETFAVLLGGTLPEVGHAYIARVDGEPAATVVTHDHEGDCSVWWVAVTPEARGRGLASGLMRRALHDGRERGCEVSTLQATKLGQPIYEKVGYRALGAIEMWERRKPARPPAPRSAPPSRRT